MRLECDTYFIFSLCRPNINHSVCVWEEMKEQTIEQKDTEAKTSQMFVNTQVCKYWWSLAIKNIPINLTPGSREIKPDFTSLPALIE